MTAEPLPANLDPCRTISTSERHHLNLECHHHLGLISVHPYPDP